MSPEGPAADGPEATRPQRAIGERAAFSGSETSPQETPRPGRRWLRWGVVVLLAALLIGAGGGYFAGAEARRAAQADRVATVTGEQFELGVQDLEAGRYEIARQRFEYVIQLDPGYPGAAERLAEALVQLNRPTATTAPLATATPNLAPVEELFTQAQEHFRNQDWSLVIETLLTLRAKDAGYMAVEADGMMYVALRNRGIQRIANEGQLEEGIYDLNRAERFGPLDSDAANWRSWAQLYQTANSYMGVNWAQAAFHFAQVYLVAPYLKNDTYLKYAISARSYADLLVDTGDPCAALPLYEESLLAWENLTLVPTATEAANMCATATAPAPRPRPTDEETPTPEGTAPTPTEEGDGNGNGGGGGGGGGGG